MLAFILGSGTVLSLIIIVLAFVLRGTAIDQAAVAKNGTDIMRYTIDNLPQVLIDGVTLGFV